MAKHSPFLLLAGALLLTSCDFNIRIDFGTGNSSEITGNSFVSSSESEIAFPYFCTKELDLGELSSLGVAFPFEELEGDIEVTFEEPSAFRVLSVEKDRIAFYPIAEGTFRFTIEANGKAVSDIIAVEDVASSYTLNQIGGTAYVGEPLPIELLGPDGTLIPMEETEFRLIEGGLDPIRLDGGDWAFPSPGFYSFGLAKAGETSCSNILSLEVKPAASSYEYLSSSVFKAADGSALPFEGAAVEIGEEIAFALLDYEKETPFEGNWRVDVNFLGTPCFEQISEVSYRATAIGAAVFSLSVETEDEDVAYLILPSWIGIEVYDPNGDTPSHLQVEGDLDGSACYLPYDGGKEFIDTGLDLVSDVLHPDHVPSAGLEIGSIEDGNIEFAFEKDVVADNVYSVYVRLNSPGSYPAYFTWGEAVYYGVVFHAFVPEESTFVLTAPKLELKVDETIIIGYEIDGGTSGYLIELESDGAGVGSFEDTMFTPFEEGTYRIGAHLLGGTLQASNELVFEVRAPFVGDPYEGMGKDEFYRDYEPAKNADDAYYRSLHGFMSGSLEVPGPTPASDPNAPLEDGLFVKNTAVEFVDDGRGYVVHDAQGKEQFTVYEDGAYITLEEVAAYIQAYGKVPANYYADRYDYPSPSESVWGEYLRLNDSYFSGDTDRYPYEPLLPDISGEGGWTDYYEVDIGTTGTYTGPSYPVRIYNDGTTITRGGARIVYAKRQAGDLITASDRHVFYTYNHYNDFQEYLNYHEGWGEIFGNVTAGGEIDEVAPGGPTPYVEVVPQELF